MMIYTSAKFLLRCKELIVTADSKHAEARVKEVLQSLCIP